MCPEARTLEQDVEALAGRRVFVPRAEAAVLVSGGVEQHAEGTRALLEVRTRAGDLLGRRELVQADGDCAALRSPLALVLTMLLESPGAPPPSEQRTGNLRVGLFGLLHTGVLPEVALGLGGSLGLLRARVLTLDLRASYFAPQNERGLAGSEARFQHWSAGLELCPRLWQRGRGSLFACSALELGALSAVPRGLLEQASATRLLGSAQLALALGVKLSRLSALWLSLGASAAWPRSRFFYRDAAGAPIELHRPAPLGAIFRLGLIIGGG